MKKVTLKLCEALLQEFRLKRAISLKKDTKDNQVSRQNSRNKKGGQQL